MTGFACVCTTEPAKERSANAGSGDSLDGEVDKEIVLPATLGGALLLVAVIVATVLLILFFRWRRKKKRKSFTY